jgi:uncharacterized membrane protein YkvA (DUF1232 family)
MTTKAKPDPGPVTPEDAIDPSKALVPAVQRVNEMRVRQGFWPKVGRVAARIPFASQVVAVYYAARDPETPMAAKGIMLGALAYFVMPLDAIPDVLAGIGFTDDAAVITAVIATLGANVRKRHRELAQKALDRLRRSSPDGGGRDQ